MNRLKLKYEPLLQGNFTPNKLNLLLVFQVNCPGCLFYAFPLFNELFVKYKSEDISFLGLSTTFEDFTKNDRLNTLKLLQEGTLVGESKKAFKTQGYSELPYDILFPVAMDQKASSIDHLKEAADHICQLNPNYKVWPKFDQKAYFDKISNYLNSLKEFSLTFTLNQLKGTPSLILFNQDHEILKKWFGPVPYEEVSEFIQLYSF